MRSPKNGRKPPGVGAQPNDNDVAGVLDAAAAGNLDRIVASIDGGQRRCLDDDDIAGVLEDLGKVGSSIGEDLKQRLKSRLNEKVRAVNIITSMISLPHHRIRELRKLQGTLDKARQALRHYQWLDDALSLASDMVAGEVASPTEPLYILGEERELPLAAIEAALMIAQTNAALDKLSSWLTLCKSVQLKLQAMGNTKKTPRRPDVGRYILVGGLVRIFEETFGLSAGITRDSPCCRFLASVLGRCESKPLSVGAAYDSWRQARDLLSYPGT